MYLLAQTSLSSQIIDALSVNGLWVFLSVCVFAGVLKHIAGKVLEHREKIAMIENGYSPDRPIEEQLAETVPYQPEKEQYRA
ncbi:MAG: hypothetical protein AAF483_23375 [Planctomycetota bacterium]